MTASFRFHIKTVSHASPSTGEGRGNAIDRDVSQDPFGLPVIPGRRLKGLIREALLELEEWDLVDAGTATRLGGEGDQPGLLRVGTAELVDADELRSWLPWLRTIGRDKAGKRAFGKEPVLRTFTLLRQQTAIDRETGAPTEHTLRRIRVLRRGLEFSATLDVRSDDPANREALALAAANVRRLGVGRHRGFGRVTCTLFENGTNLTEQVIERKLSG